MVDSEIQPLPKDSKGSTKYWLNSVQEYVLNGHEGQTTIDLLIENMGRINFGKAKNFLQRKGLVGPLFDPQESYHLNGVPITDIEVIALEFKSSWVKK